MLSHFMGSPHAMQARNTIFLHPKLTFQDARTNSFSFYTEKERTFLLRRHLLTVNATREKPLATNDADITRRMLKLIRDHGTITRSKIIDDNNSLKELVNNIYLY